MSADFPKLREQLDEIRSEFNAILREKFDAGEIEEVELWLSESNFVRRSPKTEGIVALVNCLEELAKRLDNQNKKQPETVKEELVKRIFETVQEAVETEGLIGKKDLNKDNDFEHQLTNKGNCDFQRGLEHIITNCTELKTLKIEKKHIYAAKSLLKLGKYQKLATRILIAAMDQPDNSYGSNTRSISEIAAEALGEFSSENSRFALPTNHGSDRHSDFDVRAEIKHKIKSCNYVKQNSSGHYIIQDDQNYYICTDKSRDSEGQYYSNCTEIS